MTMLTQTGVSLQPSYRPSTDQHTGATHAAGDYRSTIRKVCRFVLTILLMGGVLAGIIAVKTLAFGWHLHA